MRLKIIIMTSLLLAIMIKCIPYYGVIQKPIVNKRFRFLDYKTKQEIDELLVIPIYSTKYAIFEITNENNDSIDGYDFIAYPFIYKNGNPFSIKLFKSKFIIWGLFCAGSGKSTASEGVMIIARGFKPLWIRNLYLYTSEKWLFEGSESDSSDFTKKYFYYLTKDPGTYKLMPICSDSSLDFLSSLSKMVKRKEIICDSLKLWERENEGNIRVRFRTEELDSVELFLSRSIKKLR
jgi:hypothetical protein